MRTLRPTFAPMLAAALLLALAGAVQAQSAGGPGGGSAGGSSGSSNAAGGGVGGAEPSSGALVLYGTPGNCPPTLACGGETRRPPRPQRPATIAVAESCERREVAVTPTGRRIEICRRY